MKRLLILLLTGMIATLTGFEKPITEKEIKSNNHSRKPTSSSSEGKDAQCQGEVCASWMLESALVAKNYVEALDRGYYGQTWHKSDKLFQNIMSENDWIKALNITRKKLGNVTSRELKDQRFAKDPVGLPKGAYMVVEYNTSFVNAPHSNELLTLRRGEGGQWRVLTYQVK